MAINSVSSSTGADALSVGSKAQPDRATQSARSKASPLPAAKAAAPVAKATQSEALRPVVNTQGQTTGRIVNTKA